MPRQRLALLVLGEALLQQDRIDGDPRDGALMRRHVVGRGGAIGLQHAVAQPQPVGHGVARAQRQAVLRHQRPQPVVPRRDPGAAEFQLAALARIGLREATPAAAVARLDDAHALSGLRQFQCGGRTRQPRTHHDHVRVHGAMLAPGLSHEQPSRRSPGSGCAPAPARSSCCMRYSSRGSMGVSGRFRPALSLRAAAFAMPMAGEQQVEFEREHAMLHRENMGRAHAREKFGVAAAMRGRMAQCTMHGARPATGSVM